VKKSSSFKRGKLSPSFSERGKKMKIIRLVLILVLVVMNFSLDVSYALHVTGCDLSGRDADTLVYLNTGECLRVEVGETLIVNRKISATVRHRADWGYSRFPVKSKLKVRILLRKIEATSEQNIVFCMLSICTTGRKEEDSSLAFLTKKIPVVFPNKFPEGHVNNAKYWGHISREELHSCLPDGTAKLLTMDIDIGNKCSLCCKHCFRRDERVDVINNPLSHEEIVGYIREAKDLGLKEIKILGRGDPFENSRFLEFLREVTAMDIGIAVFTKGHVLGCDQLAQEYNEHLGINSSWELVQAVKELDKVSILLGFNSFNRKMQESFVGVDAYPETELLKDYVVFRDRALVYLVKAGFNDYMPGEATKLGMIAAPIKPENVDEIFELYTWARRRNIYMVSCPTGISGKGEDEHEREKLFEGYIPRLEDLWVQIYVWAIEQNVVSLDTFKRDGVALYPGCHVCNQTAAGFYLHLSGQVNLCPGRVEIFSKDIREDGLKKAWMSSVNYKRAKYGSKFNYRCPARDGYSLSDDFYSNIEAKVLKKFGVS